MKIISKAKELSIYNEGYYNGYKLGCEYGYAIGKIDGYNEAMGKIRSALFPEKGDE